MSKPILKKIGCSFFSNQDPKKRHFDLKFTRFSSFYEKKTWLQNPSLPWGGPEPQEHQKVAKTLFFTVYSGLAEKASRGLSTGTFEAKLRTFLEPRPQKEAKYLHFYNVFRLRKRKKNMHFYMIFGLWESNQEPKEKETTAFYLHVCRAFAS